MATEKVIKCMKLTTGEDILCEVCRDGDAYLIENPLQIFSTPSQETPGGPVRVGINLVAFLGYAATRKFKIPVDNVVTSFDPNVEMRNHYSTAFGSGIIIPEPPQIDAKKLLLS